MTHIRKFAVTATAFVALTTAGQAIAGGIDPEPAPAPAPVPAPVDDFWTGFYAGASLGMGSSNYDIFGDLSLGALTASLDLPDLGGQGPLVDIHVGYSHQVSSSFVLGAAFDATFSDIVNDTGLNIATPAGSLDFDYELSPSEMYSFTLRGGYLVSPDTQIFGLAGYTRGTFTGEADITISSPAGTTVLSDEYDFELDGFTFGGGIETRITDAISLGLEYRYTAFEDYDFINTPILGVGFETDVQTVRATVNYRF